MKTENRERAGELRVEILSLKRRVKEYSADAARLRRQIRDLDPQDPETAQAARDWSHQERHAESVAEQASRYLDRAVESLRELER